MRGIGSTAKRYVCKMDRLLPEEEQTVWELIPRNHERANRSSVKYSRALRDGSTAGDVSPEAMNQADRENFLDYCQRVYNYAFSEDFYTTHPQIKEMANEQGFIEVIDTKELLLEIARDVHNSVLEELSQAVNDQEKLTEGLKKS